MQRLFVLKEPGKDADDYFSSYRKLPAVQLFRLGLDFRLGRRYGGLFLIQFDDTDTINMAVTGDRSQMDCIAPDAMPMGINTALIAETCYTSFPDALHPHFTMQYLAGFTAVW